MKKFLLVTDSDLSLKNGVSTTWKEMIKFLEKDFVVSVIQPSLFKTIPCPTYPEIPIALCYKKIDKNILKNSDYIHIATEGPIGFEVRRLCKKYKLSYTTSFHTNFADYLHPYVNKKITYEYLKWFHKKSAKILVPTQTTKQKLKKIGFKNIVVWGRGVDEDIFKIKDIKKYEIPTFICVSRISKEKNLESFFKLNIPFEHQKIMIGNGPLLDEYKNKYKNIKFLGQMEHEEISYYLNKSHVFVFPSLTDTFGIVIIEAIACGLPVVAFNVEGPKDIITKKTGILVDDKSELIKACQKAMNMKISDKTSCDLSWKNSYKTLLRNIKKHETI